MFSWVQQWRSKLGPGPGNNCKLTQVHVDQSCAFFIVWRPKKYGPLTPLTNSKFEFVSAKTASWSCNSGPLQTSLCLRIFYFFACMPEATCKFIPIQRVNGSVTLDRSSRAAYHMLAKGICTALYMNATDRSRAANHMVAGGVCTTLYVKLNLAARQPSLAQQRRVFSHFSLSTTTLPAWKPDHSRTEASANGMFVSNSTVKRSSSRPLDKSRSCIIGWSERPNVWELPSVPIKLTHIPVKLIEGMESAFEHRNSASTRSRGTIYRSSEKSCSCAHVHAN